MTNAYQLRPWTDVVAPFFSYYEFTKLWGPDPDMEEWD